jgi:hypothetical protein
MRGMGIPLGELVLENMMGTLGMIKPSYDPCSADHNDLGKPVSQTLIILYSKLTLVKVGSASNMTFCITSECHIVTFLSGFWLSN